MIATRYMHRSDARLDVGDELISPVALCALDEGAEGGPAQYANFRSFSNGQWENVYFSMLGSRADEHIYCYYHRAFTYVVEPLGPVERDPEDQAPFIGNNVATGSLRCERAKIVEVYCNQQHGPLLENGSLHRPPKPLERSDEIKGDGIVSVEFNVKVDEGAYKALFNNYAVQAAAAGKMMERLRLDSPLAWEDK